MKLTTLSFLLLTTAVLAQSPQSSSVNYAALSAQIASMTSKLGITGSYTFPATVPNLGTILPSAPSGMAAALITGIPASVFADIVNPTSRSSLAQEFKDGNTPSWYLALPSAAQSYIEQLALQVSSVNPSYAQLTVAPTSDYTVGTDVVEPSTHTPEPTTVLPTGDTNVATSTESSASTSTDDGFATAFGSTSDSGAKATGSPKKGAAPMQTAGLTGALLGGLLAAIVAL